MHGITDAYKKSYFILTLLIQRCEKIEQSIQIGANYYLRVTTHTHLFFFSSMNISPADSYQFKQNLFIVQCSMQIMYYQDLYYKDLVEHYMVSSKPKIWD